MPNLTTKTTAELKTLDSGLGRWLDRAARQADVTAMKSLLADRRAVRTELHRRRAAPNN